MSKKFMKSAWLAMLCMITNAFGMECAHPPVVVNMDLYQMRICASHTEIKPHYTLITTAWKNLITQEINSTTAKYQKNPDFPPMVIPDDPYIVAILCAAIAQFEETKNKGSIQ